MIRKMIENDIECCGKIYAAAFPQEYWGIDWDNENAAKYIKEFYEQKHYIGFVVEIENQIVGFLSGCTKISGSKREFYINEMAVEPQMQGKGFGKQLLNMVKEYVKDNCLAGIVLYTSTYSPAKAFYEKNGFNLSDGTICMYYTE